MEFNLKTIFRIKETGKVLCFKHAVMEVITNDTNIEVITDEFGQSGNDMRTYWCQECN